MDQAIHQRYHEAVLHEACRRFGIAPDRIRPIDAFESFIFEFDRDGVGHILRLGHSLRRTEALIQGELDWINALVAAGVPAARAVPSLAGHLVEGIADGQGGHFLATTFLRAHGRSPWDLGWAPAVCEAHGRVLGAMHRQSETYTPARPAWRRPAWDDALFELVARYLPASEVAAHTQYRALCAYLHTLPTDRDAYGLIHQDAHGTNFLVDEAGQVTLFDFDECGYSWYVNDIAIALFYAVSDTPAAEAPAFAQAFMTHFLRGYQSVRPLAPRWLKEIPVFLKVREIEMYAVIHRDFDPADIPDEWCAQYMRGRKERIDHAVPYLDFDFTMLAAV